VEFIAYECELTKEKALTWFTLYGTCSSFAPREQ